MSERFEYMEADTDIDLASPVAGRPQLFTALRRRLLGSALLRHNVLLFITSMVTNALGYLNHPILGHLIGPEGYGTLASLGALGVVLLVPGQVVTSTANKFAADLMAQGRIDQVNYLFRRLTVLTLLLGVLTAMVFAAFSPLITHVLQLPTSQYVVLSSLSFIVAYSGAINSGVIQGRQQFSWFGVLNVCGKLLGLAMTAAILLAGFGITGLLIGGLFLGLLMYLISFWPIRDILRAPTARVASFRPLLVYSLGATLALGGSTYIVNIDTVLAKTFLSPREAGYYAALVTLGKIVLFIGGSLVFVMFPKVAALHQQGRPHAAVLAWTMAGVIALSASVEVVFGFFPSQIITLIFHAPLAVAQLLVWYGLAMLFLAVANVLIYYFLSLGQMAFVPVLLVCCALQTVFIALWHQTIAQIVAAMVAVMAVLLAGVVLLYVWQVATARRSIRV